jgi:hypothetical protein
LFFAPLSVAIAIKGFAAGLDPPAAGCTWHVRQEFALKRGPSPLLFPPVTTSVSANRALSVVEECLFVLGQAA